MEESVSWPGLLLPCENDEHFWDVSVRGWKGSCQTWQALSLEKCYPHPPKQTHTISNRAPQFFILNLPCLLSFSSYRVICITRVFFITFIMLSLASFFFLFKHRSTDIKQAWCSLEAHRYIEKNRIEYSSHEVLVPFPFRYRYVPSMMLVS